MILAIIIIMLIVGGVLVITGIIAFFKFRLLQTKGKHRLEIDKILIIETDLGSILMIGLGIVLLLATCYFKISLTKAEKRIESQASQLSAVVQGGTALAMVPFDELAVMDTQSTQLKKDVIEQFQQTQAKTYEQFLNYANDERFSLLVLEGLGKNSFGLVTIPNDRVPDLNDFLQKVSSGFPTNAKVQLEVAKTYRSLYQSLTVTEDEKSYFLKRWGAIVDGLKSLQADDEAERYGINLISGLYYQNIGQLRLALEAILMAAEIAPSEEKYKTSFNLGNIYLNLASKEDDKQQSEKCYENSIEQSLKSEELAQELGIHFWQPRFNIGVAYLWTERYNESIDAFLSSYGIAQLAGESELFRHYILKVKSIDKLCKFKSFADKFPEACESKENFD